MSLNKPWKGLIVSGYLFAILGGLLGIVIGMYLTFGNFDEHTKKQGRTIIFISAIVLILYYFSSR